MALGKLLRTAGYRQGFLEGQGEVRVRWQTGFLATIRGLYKNSFASLDFSLTKTLFSAVFILGINTVICAMPFITHGFLRSLYAAASLLMLGVYYVSGRVLGISSGRAVASALGAPLGGVLFAWTLLASAFITLRQGGVQWRGTLYPIKLLKGRQIRI